MPAIYTTGYAGQDPAALQRWLEALDGVVFDIRFNPQSRKPRWTKAALARRLGARYMHVPALGNRNYKGGPIALVDLEAGLAQLAQETRPVVLLCVCGDAATCHRTVVAEALRARGVPVSERALEAAVC
jgi:uncharacterized protein (DUF488 family)